MILNANNMKQIFKIYNAIEIIVTPIGIIQENDIIHLFIDQNN